MNKPTRKIPAANVETLTDIEVDAALPVDTPPEIGALVTVLGRDCRVIRVMDFGTMDVESIDGEYDYRVTGLGWGLQRVESATRKEGAR